MPKRVAPKRGWRSQANFFFPPKPYVIYTEATVRRICEKHKIPLAHVEGFHKNLENWGHAYNSFDADADTKPTNAQVKAAIQETKAQAEKLLGLVSGFDEITDRLMARTWYELVEDGRRNKEAAIRKIGAMIEFQAEGGTGYRYHDWDDIRNCLRFLMLLSDTALPKVPRGPRGRKRHEALDLWVTQVAAFWFEDLDRPLTVDAIKGQGISPATSFLADCMRPLDSKAVKSLPNALKRVHPDLIRCKIAPYKIQLLVQTKPA